jgi:hypothetical protein
MKGPGLLSESHRRSSSSFGKVGIQAAQMVGPAFPE